MMLCLAVLPGQAMAQEVEVVEVLTYHLDPPFLYQDQALPGFTNELVGYLNRQAPDRFRFSLTPLPRNRLNLRLDGGGKGIVPWVNNVWFDDVDERRFLWTDGYAVDGDVIVLKSDSPLIYESPESLIGQRLGSVRGFRFKGIDQLVATGQITRSDTGSIPQAIRMLSAGRVDAVIAPRSATVLSINDLELTKDLRIEPVFHSRYERKFMVLDRRSDIHAFLNDVVAKMTNDPAWQDIAGKY